MSKGTTFFGISNKAQGNLNLTGKDLMGPEHKKEIEAIRESTAKVALEIIRTAMPKKVIYFTELLASPELNLKPAEIKALIGKESSAFPPLLSSSHQPESNSMGEEATATSSASNEEWNSSNSSAPPKKKRKTADGSSVDATVSIQSGIDNIHHNSNASSNSTPQSLQQVRAHPVIAAKLKLLKSNLLEFIENITSVKIWIQLNIPRIEDGNNFGVGIQEEILGELGRAEEAAFNTLEHIPKYYLMRAKYITKALKYPGIEDYSKSISELDEKEYVDVIMVLRDLKNHYSILHDMISKNWDRIKKPRSESGMNLY